MLEMTTTVRVRWLRKRWGKKRGLLLKGGMTRNTVATYYIGNYLCAWKIPTNTCGRSTGFWLWWGSSDSEFDFDEFEYDYLKTENNEVVVHTFTVKDEAALGALEGIIPDYGTVSRFEMELIFIIDKKPKKNWETRICTSRCSSEPQNWHGNADENQQVLEVMSNWKSFKIHGSDCGVRKQTRGFRTHDSGTRQL